MLVISLKRYMGAATTKDPCPIQRRVEQWLLIDMTLSVRVLRPLFAASGSLVEKIGIIPPVGTFMTTVCVRVNGISANKTCACDGKPHSMAESPWALHCASSCLSAYSHQVQQHPQLLRVCVNTNRPHGQVGPGFIDKPLVVRRCPCKLKE